MNLVFTLPHDRETGLIASLLRQSYADLLECDPEHWEPEVPKWEQYDREVHGYPDTVGACLFLSWFENRIIGFGSYDPREEPSHGIIGHNCVLPEFRGKGFGKQQIREIIRRFQARGIRRARVSTNDHPFFIPAQRMYLACGFKEVGRTPWDCNPAQNLIRYEYAIDNKTIAPYS